MIELLVVDLACLSGTLVHKCKCNFTSREPPGLLRPVSAVVPRVLPRDDDGRPHPVPHRDVDALDTHGPHSRDEELIVHGVSVTTHTTFLPYNFWSSNFVFILLLQNLFLRETLLVLLHVSPLGVQVEADEAGRHCQGRREEQKGARKHVQGGAVDSPVGQVMTQTQVKFSDLFTLLMSQKY